MIRTPESRSARPKYTPEGGLLWIGRSMFATLRPGVFGVLVLLVLVSCSGDSRAPQVTITQPWSGDTHARRVQVSFPSITGIDQRQNIRDGFRAENDVAAILYESAVGDPQLSRLKLEVFVRLVARKPGQLGKDKFGNDVPGNAARTESIFSKVYEGSEISEIRRYRSKQLFMDGPFDKPEFDEKLFD